MGKIAVIDTETTWDNRVMSVGIAVAEENTFQLLDSRYYVLTPEYEVGGMFSHVMFLDGISPRICSRSAAMADIQNWLNGHGVTAVFAYNAGFDKGHLPELGRYKWYDILRLAAYRQYNPKIPCRAECCATGRLKRGYGVEPIYRMLSGDSAYCEVHNALCDAIDELQIMRLLGHGTDAYIPL